MTRAYLTVNCGGFRDADNESAIRGSIVVNEDMIGSAFLTAYSRKKEVVLRLQSGQLDKLAELIDTMRKTFVKHGAKTPPGVHVDPDGDVLDLSSCGLYEPPASELNEPPEVHDLDRPDDVRDGGAADTPRLT